MWVATFHAEESMPHIIARHKFRGVVELAAERFVDRIPHPDITPHWVTIEEENDDDGRSYKHLRPTEEG